MDKKQISKWQNWPKTTQILHKNKACLIGLDDDARRLGSLAAAVATLRNRRHQRLAHDASSVSGRGNDRDPIGGHRVGVPETAQHQPVAVERRRLGVGLETKHDPSFEENFKLGGDGAVYDEIRTGGYHDEQVTQRLQAHDVSVGDPHLLRACNENGAT